MDSKGRVSIPANYRAELLRGGGEAPILTLGQECLELHPFERFRDRMESLSAKYPEHHPGSEPGRRWLRELIYLDGQHRFVLPEELKTQAKLEKDVVFVASK